MLILWYTTELGQHLEFRLRSDVHSYTLHVHLERGSFNMDVSKNINCRKKSNFPLHGIYNGIQILIEWKKGIEKSDRALGSFTSNSQ